MFLKGILPGALKVTLNSVVTMTLRQIDISVTHRKATKPLLLL